MIEHVSMNDVALETNQKLAHILLRGVGAIRQAQLPTGEIPSYRRNSRQKLDYMLSPFVSTFVHDSLGCFDPRSLWVEAATVYLIPAHQRQMFVRGVATIRQRIRAFLAWQEEANGVWRFFGRNSGIDPDSDTTACAATILLESRRTPSDGWRRHLDALMRFRAAEKRYFSYVHNDGRGYTWMDQQGQPILGFDRVVNANILRFLALVGSDVQELMTYLLEEVHAGDFTQGSPDYPNPLCFGYMLARAWRHGHLPTEALGSALLPHVLELQHEDGSFGGPLSTGLALSTMLDLGYRGLPRDRARQALLDIMQPGETWEYEDFFVQGFGSPAWSTSLALTVLARDAVDMGSSVDGI